MSNIHILQFKYVDSSGMKVFLKVHNTFRHHYTGEIMRWVQFDYFEEGYACSGFGVINQAEFEAFYNRRIEEDENAEGKSSGDD